MFWTDPKESEPLRQHRWLLSNGAGVWVWAKSVKLPQYTVETQKYQIGNHKLNYPGLFEWQDVAITIVDDRTALEGQDVTKSVNKTRSKHLFEIAGFGGYNIGEVNKPDGMSKKKMIEQVKKVFGEQKDTDMSDLYIQQINSFGVEIQSWRLYSPFIKDVAFGQLDYSSDELITLDLTIAYDHAKLEKNQIA